MAITCCVGTCCRCVKRYKLFSRRHHATWFSFQLTPCESTGFLLRSLAFWLLWPDEWKLFRPILYRELRGVYQTKRLLLSIVTKLDKSEFCGFHLKLFSFAKYRTTFGPSNHSSSHVWWLSGQFDCEPHEARHFRPRQLPQERRTSESLHSAIDIVGWISVASRRRTSSEVVVFTSDSPPKKTVLSDLLINLSDISLQADTELKCAITIPAVWPVRSHYEKFRDGDANSGSGQPAAHVVQTAVGRAGHQKGSWFDGSLAVHSTRGVADRGEAHGGVGGVGRTRRSAADGGQEIPRRQRQTRDVQVSSSTRRRPSKFS